MSAGIKISRKKERESIKNAVDVYLKREIASKKGKYSKEEDFMLSTLPKFDQYMEQHPGKIEMKDIMDVRLPGFMDKFLSEHGIPAGQKSAFKMRVSRLRRKHH